MDQTKPPGRFPPQCHTEPPRAVSLESNVSTNAVHNINMLDLQKTFYSNCRRCYLHRSADNNIAASYGDICHGGSYIREPHGHHSLLHWHVFLDVVTRGHIRLSSPSRTVPMSMHRRALRRIVYDDTVWKWIELKEVAMDITIEAQGTTRVMCENCANDMRETSNSPLASTQHTWIQSQAEQTVGWEDGLEKTLQCAPRLDSMQEGLGMDRGLSPLRPSKWLLDDLTPSLSC